MLETRSVVTPGERLQHLSVDVASILLLLCARHLRTSVSDEAHAIMAVVREIIDAHTRFAAVAVAPWVVAFVL